MNARKAIAVTALMAMLVPMTQVATAAGNYRSPTASSTHWADHNGGQTWIRVEDKTGWKGALRLALRRWSRSSEIAMRLTDDCSDLPRCVTVEKSPLPEPNAGLATNAAWDDGHLAWGKVEILPGIDTFRSRVHIFCHEIGHTLGLVHPADGSQGPCRGGRPTNDDYLALREMLGHVDD